jgi:plasmid maintenance system antidote protein VapI
MSWNVFILRARILESLHIYLTFRFASLSGVLQKTEKNFVSAVRLRSSLQTQLCGLAAYFGVNPQFWLNLVEDMAARKRASNSLPRGSCESSQIARLLPHGEPVSHKSRYSVDWRELNRSNNRI